MNPAYRQRPDFGGGHRRGAVLVLVTCMMVVILGMAVFAVDVGWIVTNRTQLQSAADAGALAGANTMVETPDLGPVEGEALHYVGINAPTSFASVFFGTWEPSTRTFTPTSFDPNAVRVVVERTAQRDNAIPSFLAKIFGHERFDARLEAVALGKVGSVEDGLGPTLVTVTASRDLSNVVLDFGDDVHQKFEDLSGRTLTFSGRGEHAGKVILGIWVKTGPYESDEGSGYGHYLEYPGDGSPVSGSFDGPGKTQTQVTATFGSPARLVK